MDREPPLRRELNNRVLGSMTVMLRHYATGIDLTPEPQDDYSHGSGKKLPNDFDGPALTDEDPTPLMNPVLTNDVAPRLLGFSARPGDEEE